MPTETPSETPCLWKLDDYSSCYDTGCQNAYCIDEAIPGRGAYRYCPGCGKRIKVEVRIEPL